MPVDPTSSERVESQLRKLRSERTVGLIAVSSVDYLRRYFDLLDSGAVVVPLRSDGDHYRIEACKVERVVKPAEDWGWFERRVELPDTESLAQVSFTSGTEGEPKGVRLTHRNLSSTAVRIQQAMGLTDQVREYIGVPVYHSFGLGRARAVNAAGGRVYIPEHGFDLREIVNMLAAGDINAVSAVPSLWRLVLRNRQMFAPHAAALLWIEIGSQPMSAEDKRALRELFSSARIVQHYGLTEASRSSFLDVSAATDAELESVGRPNGDVEISIEGSGRIRIRGSHVAREQIVGGRIIASTDPQGWLTTSDLGEWRNGLLYFLGRADDVINLGGIKVSPDLVEDAMASELSHRDEYCVVRVPDELRGDGVLVALLMQSKISDQHISAVCESALRSLGVQGTSSLYVQRFATLPRTDSGKPRRREIASLFKSPKGDPGGAVRFRARSPISRLLSRYDRSDVRALFERSFPGRTFNDDATFVSLGGDSLSFVELSVKLESAIGRLPPGWQNLSIRELMTTPREVAWLHDVDTTVFFRCIGMIAILMGHFDVADVGGATYLLLAVAGFNFARFQLPSVIQSGSVRPILATAMRIAIPTFLALSVLELKSDDLEVMALLLLDNWTDATSERFGFWFLELMVQVLLLVSVLLAIPPARRLARERPFFFAFGGLLVTTFSAVVVPMFWSTEHLFNRVPHMMLWLFMLGWVLRVATHAWQRFLSALMVLLLPPLIWEHVINRYWMQHGMFWVWGGLLMLTIWPSIQIVKPFHRIVALIASASMFIYIIHYTVRGLWQRFGTFESPMFEVVLGIAGGIVCWWLWELATRLMAALFTDGGHNAGRSGQAV